jgi:hypothetical protein
MCWLNTGVETFSVESEHNCENCEASETSYIECELPPSSRNHQNTHQWRKWNLLLLHSSRNHVQAHLCRWWNIIRQNTLLITTHLGVDNITCSNGLINWLKSRNNCLCNSNRWKQACWFRNSSWLEKSLTGAEEYDPFDINSDETGLSLNQQPSESRTFHDGTKSNQQVTMLHACSADGSRNYHHL